MLSRAFAGGVFRRRWLLWIAALLAGVMAGSVVQAPAMAQAASAPRASKTSNSSAVVAQSADTVSAVMAARKQGSKVEVLADRTSYAQTFANPNGTLTYDFSPSPRWVQQGSSWVAPDATLTWNKDGSLSPKASVAELTLSGGGNGALASVDVGGKTLSLSWPSSLPTPSVSGSAATYANVLPGVDLVLTASVAGSFEETLVVKTAAAAKDTGLADLHLKLALSKGLSQSADRAGNLAVKDSSGKVLFSSPAPTAWDSAVAVGAKVASGTNGPGRGAHIAQMSATYAPGSVRLGVPSSLLTGASTRFPVYLAPSYNVSPGWEAFADVHSASPTTNYSSGSSPQGVGYDGTSTDRLYWQAGIPSAVDGAQVISATLYPTVYTATTSASTSDTLQVYSTSQLFSTTATWNSQPTQQAGPVSSTFTTSSTTPNLQLSVDITSFIQAAATANAWQWTGEAVNANETSSTHFVGMSPYPGYVITYDHVPYPSNGLALNPGKWSSDGNYYTSSATPTLNVTGVDPDGDQVQAQYQILSGSTVVASGSSAFVASSSNAPWADTTALADGTTYSVKVRFYDGTVYSAWTSEPSFTVETDTPTAPVVTCTGYPAAAWSAPISGSTTCSWTETLTHMNGYIVNLDGTYSWSTPASTSINPGVGEHTLTVTPQSAAGIDGPSTSYIFGVGASGAMLAPGDQSQTSTSVTLQAAAPSGYTSATFEYRYGTSGSFTAIPNHVVFQCNCPVTWPVSTSSGPVGVQTAQLTWYLNRTLSDDGPVQVEAVFTDSTGDTDTTPPVTVTLDRLGSGTDYGTTTAGPVSVGLQSGNAALSTTDVSIASYGAQLSVSRTFNSVAPSAASIFGPGWVSSVASSTASSWASVTDDGSYAVLAGGDGSIYSFAAGSTTSGVTAYAGDGSVTVAGLTLTKNASANTFTLTESSGAATTFALNGAGSTKYAPSTITAAGTSKSVGYVYDSTGRPLLVVAPDAASSQPSTTACPSPASSSTWTTAGCRGLAFSYDPSSSNVAEIDFVYVDNAGGFHSVAVAKYGYDILGKLTSEWDPRLSTPLKSTYTYDETSSDADYGRITQISPAQAAGSGALEPWNLTYDDTVADVNYGKILTTSRTHSATYGGGTATSTIDYSVPLTTVSGGPVNMDAATVATWGQGDLPASAVAVWNAAHVPASTPTATDYTYATVHYYDANGREVNTATYVNGGWAVSTTEYDTYGNKTRELSAANRATALASGSPLGTAQSLDTRYLYACDNFGAIAACTSANQKYQVLTDTYGPAHSANVDGTTETIRTHTAYAYDAGAPNSDSNPAGNPYALTTSETISASVGSGVPGSSTADARTTQYLYSNGSDSLGWALGAPLKTVTDPAGLANTATTVYNENVSLYGGDNLVTDTYQPSTTSGGTAGDTETVYYTAGTNSVDSSCGNQPAWANLTCKTEPAAQVSGSSLANLPVTAYTYNDYLSAATKTETYGSTGTRTTTFGYDAANRQISAVIATTGTGMGAAIPKTETVYAANTGLVTDAQSLSSSGAVTADLASGYDDFGQQLTYTDATGIQSTAAYDLAGRVTSRYDGQGTDTISYSPGGQAVSEADSLAGSFTATYDPDGVLSTEVYPDGTAALRTIDPTGTATSLTYTNTHWSSSIADTLTLDAQGDWMSQSVMNASYAYGYDTADRLTSVADTQSGSCTKRVYGYDADSNRTSLTTYAAAAGGACQSSSGTAETYSYDAADRLLSSTIGGTATTYGYDTQGDVTATPSADAGGSGTLTAAYYANGMLSSQTQSGTTYSWSLDPTQSRFATWTSGSTTTTNHYADDSDNLSWSAVGTTWARTTEGLDGQLAATTTSTGVTTFELPDLHGDVMASVLPSSDTAPAAAYSYTEFGKVESGSAAPGEYGYLGGYERSSQALGESLLMGARGYSSGDGRFSQTDPIRGGSANAYDYADQNPLTNVDPTGGLSISGTCWQTRHWFITVTNCLYDLSRDATKHLSEWGGAGIIGTIIGLIRKIPRLIGITGVVLTFLILDANRAVEHHGCVAVELAFGFIPIRDGWDNSSICHNT